MSETRILEIPQEFWEFVVIAESRVELIQYEDRVYVVPTEQQGE